MITFTRFFSLLIIAFAFPVCAMQKPIMPAVVASDLISPRSVASGAQKYVRAVEKLRSQRLYDSNYYDFDANRSLVDDIIVSLRLDESDVQDLMLGLQKKFPFNLTKMHDFFRVKKEQCRLEEHLRVSAEGDIEGIKDCLIRGVNINAPDKQGRTALLLAAGVWNIEGVKLLLKYGAHVNARDDNQDSALDYAQNASIYFAPPEALIQMLKPAAVRRATH